MANQLTGNPIVLDTANNATVLIPQRVCINGLEWINPANTNDAVEITDKNGKLIWGTVAAANNAGSISAGFAPGWVEGFILTKLDSGKLTLMIG